MPSWALHVEGERKENVDAIRIENRIGSNLIKRVLTMRIESAMKKSILC